MEQEMTLLRQFESLKDVPDQQLQWLVDNSELMQIPDESLISSAGDVIRGPYFLLEGNIVLYMKQGNENVEIRTLAHGDIFGYLPYSRGFIANVYARALTGVKFFAFNTDAIRVMMRDHFELTQALVHIMNNRVKDFTALQQHNDKMAALGKMAAGLAHELNNPAAALSRDAIALRNHLKMEPKTLRALTGLQLEPHQIDRLNQELASIRSLEGTPRLSLKEKMKQEDILSEWLEEKNIEDAEAIAETLVGLNVSIDNLRCIEQNVAPSAISTIIDWTQNVLVREKIMDDIQVSSTRIGELVKSIKIYTHMDRGADKILIDIHEGLRNTINILGFKIRKYNIVLTEKYDETLPKVLAYPGELNQVWTNLIDNALDAMEGNKEGLLTITTERDREFVKITINDNGSGIPESILQHVFDPFFTTKDVGKGTGMGLETVQRIIHKHKGTVKVTSAPGNTSFVICFPMNHNTTNIKQ